ncbi:hypothetical protein [Infirmifilum sp. NZ]|uniref:hypothetical protein n=1 Tax=Infirmifilum sp. NZ TaxID=2926850 RepID=UPI00279C36F6|nr:hypothetical protein [Infirmifilum sp. NZ]UNQ72698.1 hypothetical protein MOV14_06150 [Infirmifilum sp. NZ]
MPCLRKIDYVFALGVLLLVTGLVARLYTWLGPRLDAPSLLLIFPIIYILHAVAERRGIDGGVALLAPSLVAVLASPYVLLSAKMLEEDIRSGQIASPFLNDFMARGEGLTVPYVLAFAVFLAAMLLGSILVRNLLGSVQLESPSNPVFMLSEKPGIQRWSAIGVLAGVLVAALIPSEPHMFVIAPLCVLIMLSSTFIQASLMFYISLEYFLGVPFGMVGALTALFLYSLAVNTGKKEGEASATLLMTSSFLLIMTLAFFIVFGTGFPLYIAFFLLNVLLVSAFVVQVEGRSFILSPFIASYVVLLVSYSLPEQLRLLSLPVAPFIIAAIPGVLASLYLNLIKPRYESDECTFTPVAAVALLSQPLAFALLQAEASSIQLPQQPVQSTQASLLLPILALLVTLLQRRFSKSLFNRGSWLFIPASFTVLHPAGLALASALYQLLSIDGVVLMVIFSAVALALNITAFLKGVSLQGFKIMFTIGMGIGLAIRVIF